MKKLMISWSLMLVTSITAIAQETKQVTKEGGHGYLFFAPGVAAPGSETLVHVGGGGEKLFNGIGVGAEIGYLTEMQLRYLGDGVGVFSANGSYHFTNHTVSPFVTGGYSMFFRGGYVNGFNFGAGVNCWVSRKMAVRFEVRDNVWPDYSNQHFVGFRVGATFR